MRERHKKDDPSSAKRYYTFRNREGQSIHLRGDMTIEDLIRAGYTDINLVNPERPIAPHEWRCDGEESNRTEIK